MADCPVENRVCMVCRHFFFDGGSPGYSELTPAEGSTMSCHKQRWTDWSGRRAGTIQFTDLTEETFRDTLLQAVDCPDFEPAKEA